MADQETTLGPEGEIPQDASGLPDLDGGPTEGLPEIGEISATDVNADLDALSATPELTELPEAGDLPDIGASADAAALPDVGGLPDLGGLPDIGAAPEAGALPDLGDLQPAEAPAPMMNNGPRTGDTVLDINKIQGLKVKIQAVLGTIPLTISELVNIEKGDLLQLETKIGDPISILANGDPIAKAEIVVTQDDPPRFALTVTEIIASSADKG